MQCPSHRTITPLLADTVVETASLVGDFMVISMLQATLSGLGNTEEGTEES